MSDQPRLRRVVDLLIPESGVDFERFQVCGTGFFDESDLSQVRLGQFRGFPPWRQRTGNAVLEGSEGGNRLGGPRAVTPSRENTSGTPGTTSDNHFRSAAATLETTQDGPDPPPVSISALQFNYQNQPSKFNNSVLGATSHDALLTANCAIGPNANQHANHCILSASTPPSVFVAQRSA